MNYYVKPAYFLGSIAWGLFSLGNLRADTFYVNSREIVLSYQSINRQPVESVHTWVRRAGDADWESAACAPAGPNSVIFVAPRDDKYQFYIVLTGRGGASAPPPVADSAAHLEVVCDTTPPIVQIHRATQCETSGEAFGLRLQVTLAEEHLGDGGLRIFYRANAQAGWVDGGPATNHSGVITWMPPAKLPEVIDIRLAVTDRAGNRAVDELCAVSLPRGAPLPAGSTRIEPTSVMTEAVVVPMVEPVSVEAVEAVVLSEQPAARSEPNDVEALLNRRRAEDLHRQAAAFLSEGRYTLAGTRLEDALELTPDEPEMLVDLGGAYYRVHKFDSADERYQRALQLKPDHPGALEGLALVAATQKRYADSREYLQRLLKLQPNAADHWLHFGDVEHMLGDRQAARAAWEHAVRLDAPDDFVRKEAQKRLNVFQAK